MADWDELDDDLAAIMEETPVGDNYGTSASSIPTSHGVTGAEPDSGVAIVYAKTSSQPPRRSLNTKDHEARHATQSITSDEREFHYLGMTAHRGTLHPDEYVDHEALNFSIEMRLGFTLERIQFLYSKPNPKAKDLPDKEKLEDIFLELEEAEGNMILLAKVLGFQVREDGSSTTCFTMSRAISRARKRREESG